MTRLRLAFMGTPAFAAEVLAALLAAGHEVAAVYCQPPRPAGRGHRPQPSPVQRLAAEKALELRMPERLGAAEAAEFAALRLDAAVVAAYGLLLPKAVLAAPRLGCLNVHASLLPRWRGAAPIERALLAGDAKTGVTIMQMEEGLDTGPMLLAEATAIGPADTAATLHARLAGIGARLVVAALDGVAGGALAPVPQPAEGASYARKLRREEGQLDWRQPAAALERAIRALNPAPGTWFDKDGERIKLLAAVAEAGEPPGGVPPEGVPGTVPGTVLDAALRIACGEGVLRPLLLQRPGRGPLAPQALLNGYPIPPGTRLPCPATA